MVKEQIIWFLVDYCEVKRVIILIINVSLDVLPYRLKLLHRFHELVVNRFPIVIQVT